MPFPLIALLAGAALGKVNRDEKQKEFERQRKIQAETTRMSPWTGLKADAPTAAPGELGSVAGGALSGYMFGQQNPGLSGASNGAAQGGGDPAAFASQLQGMESLQPTGGPRVGDYSQPSFSPWDQSNMMPNKRKDIYNPWGDLNYRV